MSTVKTQSKVKTIVGLTIQSIEAAKYNDLVMWGSQLKIFKTGMKKDELRTALKKAIKPVKATVSSDTRKSSKKAKVEATAIRAPKAGSKSEKFLELFDKGKTVGQIAATKDAHYSYVYGVIERYRPEELKARSTRK